ncbi:MAG: putative sulfate exporter family transporter [Bacteroidota bacterium]
MKFRKILFYWLAIITLTPFINSAAALLFGIVVGYVLEGFYEQKQNDKFAKQLLKISIVGLGFTLSIKEVLDVSSQSIFITLISILLTFGFAYLLSIKLKLSPKMCFLIASGTAICGGSAIAAVSPVIRAKSKDISNAILSIFLLNGVALLIFPVLGKIFHLSDFQFGLWSAIAIHDTSSVAGASAAFSDNAFQVATITKLVRTLYIIPLVFVASYYFKSKNEKFSIPLFIVMFIVAVLIGNYLIPDNIKHFIKAGSKEMLDLAIFFIGTSFKVKNFKHFLSRPFLMSLLLWIFISVSSLIVIYWMY